MKSTIIGLGMLGLAGCGLTPAERSALTAATAQIGVAALNKLAEVGKSPIEVSQTTHDLMTYGCEIFYNQKGVFDPLLALLVARVNDETENPVTPTELTGYIETGCSILDQLPIEEA